MNITFTDPLGLHDVIAFAEVNHCTDELGRGLVRLLRTMTDSMTYNAHQQRRTAEIGKDFAPHSFTFCIWEGERLRSNVVLAGGLIYHKNNQTWHVHT